MNSPFSSIITLFSIAAIILSATAGPGATNSVEMESSNLLLWGDSARECFEVPESPSVNSVNAECWSKKVRMLLPLLTDKSMTLSTAMKQTAAQPSKFKHPERYSPSQLVPFLKFEGLNTYSYSCVA